MLRSSDRWRIVCVMTNSTALRTPAKPSRSGRMRPVTPSKTNRSRCSNSPLALPGLDGRSAEARRFRDLVLSFAEPLGGVDGLSEENASLVRQAASITMANEAIQSAAVRGEHVDAEQVVRLTNALTRVLAALRARRRVKKEPTYLERLRAEAAGK